MSDSIFQLGKFKFRSTSSDVNVFFEGQGEGIDKDDIDLTHTENELKESYEKGFLDGQAPLNEEITQLKAELIQQQQIMQEEKQSLATSYQSVLSTIEEQMTQSTISTSFKLAELILLDELKNKDTLLNMMTELFKNIQTSGKALLKLSPNDYEKIGNELSSENIQCISDKSLQNGDLQVEQPDGHWDANLKCRLEVLREEFNSLVDQTEQEDV